MTTAAPPPLLRPAQDLRNWAVCTGRIERGGETISSISPGGFLVVCGGPCAQDLKLHFSYPLFRDARPNVFTWLRLSVPRAQGAASPGGFSGLLLNSTTLDEWVINLNRQALVSGPVDAVAVRAPTLLGPIRPEQPPAAAFAGAGEELQTVILRASLASPGRPFSPFAWPAAVVGPPPSAPWWGPASRRSCGIFGGDEFTSPGAPLALNGGRPLVRNLAAPRNCPGVWAVESSAPVGSTGEAPYVYLSADPFGLSDLGAPARLSLSRGQAARRRSEGPMPRRLLSHARCSHARRPRVHQQLLHRPLPQLHSVNVQVRARSIRRSSSEASALHASRCNQEIGKPTLQAPLGEAGAERCTAAAWPPHVNVGRSCCRLLRGRRALLTDAAGPPPRRPRRNAPAPSLLPA